MHCQWPSRSADQGRRLGRCWCQRMSPQMLAAHAGGSPTAWPALQQETEHAGRQQWLTPQQDMQHGVSSHERCALHYHHVSHTASVVASCCDAASHILTQAMHLLLMETTKGVVQGTYTRHTPVLGASTCAFCRCTPLVSRLLRPLIPQDGHLVSPNGPLHHDSVSHIIGHIIVLQATCSCCPGRLGDWSF